MSADALGFGLPAKVIQVPASLIASPHPEMLQDRSAIYQLNVAPFTRYVSAGTFLTPLFQGALDSSGNTIGLASGGNRLRTFTSPTDEQVTVSRTYRGSIGKKVASWANALQNSGGTAALVTGDLPPFADNATNVLKLTQNATASFGQQNPLDGNQPYMPSGTSPAFNFGIWAKNPNSRTLNFEVRLYNGAANHAIWWNCAIEPTGAWTFLTLSATQALNSGWVFGTDAITYVRVTQKDNGAEGAWAAGEYLLFGNAYADVKARPRFLITFDDGNDSQRNPNSTAIVSGSAYVASSLTNVFTTAAPHALVIGAAIKFTDTAPTSLALNTTYYVGVTSFGASTFTLYTDALLTTQATSTGFSGTANYVYAGEQSRSGQGIVESYGFRGSLFIVPAWLGTSGQYGYGGGVNKFMSAADVQAMWAAGWSVGSHSNSHPSNNESAGLRLLGPYGYYLSNTVDNLSAKYVSAWSLGASNRRRATSAATGTNIITFENNHKFLINMPIVFTDVAPNGLALGTTYYVKTIPAGNTCTLATDQGTLANTAVISSTWTGTANYRYAGSSIDDSAIYNDIVSGIAGIAALGISTGAKFFALPQGGADEFVRSACVRAGLAWVRGVGSTTHSIPVGVPSGGGQSNMVNWPGGWLAQPDCIQTDGVSPTIVAIRTYVDETITQGACGCSYHHSVATSTIPNLDNLCAYLRIKVDAKALDVMTLDEMAAVYGI